MNLVRLGMIIALAAIAWYSLSIYAAIPSATIVEAPRVVQTNVTYMCPVVENSQSGIGSIVVACLAIGGALSVSAVDLSRRVY